jgi:hypothetical protein
LSARAERCARCAVRAAQARGGGLRALRSLTQAARGFSEGYATSSHIDGTCRGRGFKEEGEINARRRSVRGVAALAAAAGGGRTWLLAMERAAACDGAGHRGER